MTKPTGKPRGRPKKAPEETVAFLRAKLKAQTIARRKADAPPAEPLFGMTAEQIDRITPKVFFRHALMDAVKEGDLPRARDAARDWAPYEHARPIAAQPLTPEELRRIADLARSEATRRGYDIAGSPEPAAGAIAH